MKSIFSQNSSSTVFYIEPTFAMYLQILQGQFIGFQFFNSLFKFV